MKIAVLAVQGAFIEHEKALQRLGAETVELRKAEDLEQDFDGLVLPGGESTVQSRLLKELSMFEPLKEKVEETKKEKHDKDAKHGWYRYDVRFAIPVYENDVLIRYNVFRARLLINHAQNGKKYLYDILTIKKKKNKPQQ